MEKKKKKTLSSCKSATLNIVWKLACTHVAVTDICSGVQHVYCLSVCWGESNKVVAAGHNENRVMFNYYTLSHFFTTI